MIFSQPLQPIFKILNFIFRRTIILFLALIVFSRILVDTDKMKIKELNRVVPASMDDLVKFHQDPSKENKVLLEKYVLYFKTAVKVLTKSAAAHGMLGYCYYHLGSISKAVESYKKASAVEPKFFWFRHSLGTIYFQQKNYA